MAEISNYEIYLMAGVLIPLASFFILMLFGPRIGKPVAGWLTVLAMASSCALATITLVGWHADVNTPPDSITGRTVAQQLSIDASHNQFHWADIGSVPIKIGVKLDSLTVIMFFMVTFIATWIFIFSVGYMSGHSDEVDGKSKYHRFFCYLSLFGFSMLGLVISSNLLFLFMLWELVGLCSYLLIGFYFDKKFASNAAMKAFITNRVGDFGFIFGLMMVFFFLKTFDLDQAAIEFGRQFASSTGVFDAGFAINLFGWHVSGAMLATMMGIGLFCGAMGKSAQFPLQVWLPDAMAGPTPVSALIHAATMVAAGVYLVARIFRLLTPEAQFFIAVIGCITLTAMALIAMVQTDIKKCLAYSTLSQLGYMIFGMGVGAWTAALFHLMLHAFFKAMLFLGSGQVIEGCHHEQDMRKMGGLMKKMPMTGITFLVGVLAISGFGIPLMNVGLGGYFSKDEILAVAWDRAYMWHEPIEHHGDSGHGDAGGHGDSGGYADASGHADLGGYGEIDSHGSVMPSDASASSFMLVSDQHGSTGHDTGHADSGHADSGHDDSGHGDSLHGEAGHASGSHALGSVESLKASIPPLPKWMFWLALITAYVTPFYMMRCWWMTFMGKPRDQHVYDHAHESPLMWVPLVALAISTFGASYFVFRPMIADAAGAATDATLVLGLDGVAESAETASGALIHVHEAHHWLAYGVGGSWVIAFFVAFLIYRNGLATGAKLKAAFGPLATLLEHKYYFDELYDFLLVRGCRLAAAVCRAFDTYVIDLFANLSASIVERFAVFSGRGVDAHVVDGVFNGLAAASMDVSDLVRSPQTGRIRNYVLFAAAAAVVVVMVMLYFDGSDYPVVRHASTIGASSAGIQ